MIQEKISLSSFWNMLRKQMGPEERASFFHPLKPHALPDPEKMVEQVGEDVKLHWDYVTKRYRSVVPLPQIRRLPPQAE